MSEYITAVQTLKENNQLTPDVISVINDKIKTGVIDQNDAVEIRKMIGSESTESEKEFVRPMTWGSVVSNAVSNAPKSASQFIEDIVTPFLHPVKTAEALKGLAMGLGEKLIPGTQEDEKIVDDVIDALKERYGGVENFKKTLSNDPVGAVGDIASIFVPGGGTVKSAGTASKLSKIGMVAKAGRAAERIGETMVKAGKFIEPVEVAGNVLKKGIKTIIPKDLPGKMYQSAAKFSTTIPESARKKLAKTALDNEIMPTLSGLDNIREKINNINTTIQDKIDSATKSGNKIFIDDLFAGFDDLRDEISSEPITRRRQINRVEKEIKTYYAEKGKTHLTPNEAQRLKQKIYKETSSFYSSVKDSPARVEAKQAIASAAKESLEDIFPEIKELNRKEGDLIELRTQIERSASRISNRDLLGIGVPIKGGAGAALAGGPGMAAGAVIGVLDTPNVKARLSIIANRLKKQGVVLKKDSLMSKILDKKPSIPARQAGKLSNMKERTGNE